MELFNNLGELIDKIIDMLGVYGPMLGCFLIVVESIVPLLPLSVFITLNFLGFGSLLGFLISWICTIIGCMISFALFRGGFRRWFMERVRVKKNVNKLMKKLEEMKFQSLVVLIAIPFTPAFLINIASALSKMNIKKFGIAIAIGKLFMVYFWGFVGTSLVQSLTNPTALFKVIIASVIAYVASIIINKKFDIDFK